MSVLKLLLVLILLFSVGLAHAQDDANGPATIISFTGDVQSLPLDQVEAGGESVTLAWTAVGLNDNERIVLQRYEVNSFVTIAGEGDGEDERLALQGTLDVDITSPATFSPPMFRLALLDFRNRVIDQRIVLIPYVVSPEAEVSIDEFAAAVSSVDPTSLDNGNGRINVSWDISNRPPTANPVFEQVLPDGTSVLVELPRGVLWVPSSGSGVVAPVLPDDADEIVLRLRVIDLANGTVYDESEVRIPFTDADGDGETAEAPTAEGTEEATAETTSANIVSFTAASSSVALNDVVQLLWEVQNAASVEVAVNLPDSEALQVLATNLPLRAGLTIPLGEENFGTMETVTFTLRAMDASGNILATETLDIQVQAPAQG